MSDPEVLRSSPPPPGLPFAGLGPSLLKSWKLLVFFPLLCSVATGGVCFLLLPRFYEGRAMAILQRVRLESELEKKILLSEMEPDSFSRQRGLYSLVTAPLVSTRAFPLVKDRFTRKPATPEDLANRVNSRLDGDLITIIVQDENRENAAFVANAWASVYAEEVNNMYGQGKGRQVESLKTHVKRAEETYRKSQEALEQFLDKSTLERMVRELNTLKAQMTSLTYSLRRTEELAEDAREFRSRLLDKSSSGTGATATSINLAWLILRNEALMVASQSKSALQLAVSPLGTQERPGNPLPTIAEVDNFIDSLVQRQKRVAAILEKGDLEREIDHRTSRLEKESALKKEITQHRDLAWDTFSALSRKTMDHESAALHTHVTVIESVSPAERVSRNILLWASSAGALGLILIVGRALFADWSR